MKGREIFKVEGDSINRLRRHCPKCGEGIFLAEHKDRLSCGKCGYTEFKSPRNKHKIVKQDINIEKKDSLSSETLKETEKTE